MKSKSLSAVKKIFLHYPRPEHPIFLKNITKEMIPATPAEFLIKIITDYNKNNNTVSLLDKKIKLVTGTSYSRSITEIYYIISFYYPNYTLNQYFADIFECIYQININQLGILTGYFEKKCVLSVLFCPDINKPVFWTKNGGGLSEGDYIEYADKINKKQITWLFPPLSRLFPIPFIWTSCNKTLFWTYFLQKDFIQEIVGDKYLFLNDLDNPCIIKNLPN